MHKSLMASLAAIAAVTATPATPATGKSALMAGAAKFDISPSEASLPPGTTIRDHLYARAIVVRNDDDCAVLVGVDQGAIRGPDIDSAIARASEATGCAPKDFIISATHTHSGASTGLFGGEPTGQQVADGIVTAITAAAKTLRPARIGFGEGKVDLNVNRDVFEQNTWVQGPNEDAVSDKTLAVIELLDEQGLPIGVYMNYAMHPVMFFLSGVVSGDFPSDASRYIERRYGDDMVAIFSQGASGDQNPRMQRPYNRLAALRTGNPAADDISITAPKPWLRGLDDRNGVTRAMAAMGEPLPAEKEAEYRAAIADNSELVAAMGAIIGETAINTMRFGITELSADASIAAAQENIQCPGRDRLDRDDPIRQGALPPYADGDPVNLKMGMLRIGDIHIATVNGEVYNAISQRLKAESPDSKLLMTTLANGMANSGYIYSNEAGSHLTFQVIGSRLKPGCAEDAIVNTGLELLDEVDG